MTQTQSSRKWHYTTDELTKVKGNDPLQVIEVYRNRMDWQSGRNSIGIIAMNHNDSNREAFSSQLHLIGICYGLTAKYKHPYVICWEVGENGEKSFINAQGIWDMTRKEAIISIHKQIEAATGRDIKLSYVSHLTYREGDKWMAEYRGVIYQREATEAETLSPRERALRARELRRQRGGSDTKRHGSEACWKTMLYNILCNLQKLTILNAKNLQPANKKH